MYNQHALHVDKISSNTDLVEQYPGIVSRLWRHYGAGLDTDGMTPRET